MEIKKYSCLPQPQVPSQQRQFSLASPLEGAVQLETWGQKGPQPARPLHCNPLHCASFHSPAEWGVPWRRGWPGWHCCDAALHVCVAQTESLSGCHCLQRCCAHHQQSHSQSQYPLFDLWNWKGSPYCCVLERKGSPGCSIKTMNNKKANKTQMKRIKSSHPQTYETWLVSDLLTYQRISHGTSWSHVLLW